VGHPYGCFALNALAGIYVAFGVHASKRLSNAWSHEGQAMSWAFSWDGPITVTRAAFPVCPFGLLRPRMEAFFRLLWLLWWIALLQTIG